MARFRVLMVGTGAMAGEWVPYTLTRNDAEFVGLVEIVKPRAEEFRGHFHLNCGVYDDLAAAIRETGANLVYNITPPETHKDVVLTAMREGCDVFGEKPMADTLENALALLEAAKKCNKTYSVMQNRRFLKTTQDFKMFMKTSGIGPIGFVTTEFYIHHSPIGSFRDSLKHALLLDMSVHHFDMLRYMFDVDPVSVYCHEFAPAGSWFTDKPAAVCVFEMTKGLVFEYTGYWTGRTQQTLWEGTWRANGAMGSAIWNQKNEQYAEVLKYADPRKGDEAEHLTASDFYHGLEWHSGCIENMYESLLAGKPALTDCTDNIKSMAMVFAAIKSAEEQRKVEVVSQ